MCHQAKETIQIKLLSKLIKKEKKKVYYIIYYKYDLFVDSFFQLHELLKISSSAKVYSRKYFLKSFNHESLLPQNIKILRSGRTAKVSSSKSFVL